MTHVTEFDFYNKRHCFVIAKAKYKFLKQFSLLNTVVVRAIY
jgi:hypothetical protein